MLVYHVAADGSPSQTATVNAYPGTVPFAFVNTGRHQIALVQAGTSAVVTYRERRRHPGRGGDAGRGPGRHLLITRDGNLLFASNAGSATETRLSLGAYGALDDLGNTGTDAGSVDATAAGHNLYLQTGDAGIVDEYAISADGSLTEIGSVTVAGAAGGEGITVG